MKKDKGWNFLNSETEDYMSEEDGSWGYHPKAGGASYHGSDGSWGYRDKNGKVSYYGNDGSWGYRNEDGSGAFYDSDGQSYFYKKGEKFTPIVYNEEEVEEDETDDEEDNELYICDENEDDEEEDDSRTNVSASDVIGAAGIGLLASILIPRIYKNKKSLERYTAFKKKLKVALIVIYIASIVVFVYYVYSIFR